jgi:hypothetical protein
LEAVRTLLSAPAKLRVELPRARGADAASLDEGRPQGSRRVTTVNSRDRRKN